MAGRAHAAGNLAEAERLARQALRQDPQSLRTLLLIGIIEAKTQRFQDAQATLARVVERWPNGFEGRMWLSRVLLFLQRPEEAVEHAEAGAKLQPNEAWASIQLGTCLTLSGRAAEAEPVLRRAVQLAPKLAESHEALGITLKELGDMSGAADAFQAVWDLNPASESAGVRVAETLFESERYAQAEAAGRKLVAAFPNSSQAHSVLARSLIRLEEAESALSHAETAAALAPRDAMTVATFGIALESVGRMPEASVQFERAIDLDPQMASAYCSLAYSRKITQADAPLLTRMEGLKKEFAGSWAHLAHFSYALGKARQDLGEYELAMAQFDEANRATYRLRYGDQPFDRKAYAASIDVILQIFTKEFLREHAAGGDDSALPIFIVGMMRCGTTLAEQILSSHSQVAGGGERNFWLEHRNEPMSAGGSAVDEKVLGNLARRYLAELRAVSPEAERVVDKMPINYALLGLIHLALPNARIVHLRRHPVDTSLSIYTTPNRSRLQWSNDKANIVFAYRQYERFMRHWSAVLPENRLLDVSYEQLVEDREATTRRMVEFCGLEWEEACLFPERNSRSVFTPSVWQVRQPVYSSSVGRWRKYEPWLGPLAELLS